jgi:metal-responsive CopG/Arc/MetJ family transcriptional regulator
MKNNNGGHGLIREERLQIMLSPEELKAVDNFRFEHRMPSRAAAVRELLRHGLANVGLVVENAGIRSGEYGVLKQPKRPDRSGTNKPSK